MSLHVLHGILQPWAGNHVSLISFTLHCPNSWWEVNFPSRALSSPSAFIFLVSASVSCVYVSGLSLPLLFNWTPKSALNLEQFLISPKMLISSAWRVLFSKNQKQDYTYNSFRTIKVLFFLLNVNLGEVPSTHEETAEGLYLTLWPGEGEFKAMELCFHSPLTITVKMLKRTDTSGPSGVSSASLVSLPHPCPRRPCFP